MQSRRSWLADCSRLSLAWLAGPAFARSAGAAEVRLIPGAFRSGKLLSEVEFDGQAITCLVDTGSAISILSEAGPWNEYPSIGKIRFTSASGGIREADKIRIAEVRTGRTVWRNVELGRLNRTPGVQNTLGIDVLARAPFSLHFQQRVALELEAAMPAEVSQRLEVSSHGVFTVAAVFGQEPVRALFDTGSSLSAIDTEFAARHPGDFPESRHVLAGTDGVGEAVTVRMHRARRVRVGSRQIRNLPVVATSLKTLREGVHPDVQAVIGLNLMRKADWFFDLPNRRWGMKS